MAETSTTLEDAEIRALVQRLARPRPAGGHVVERAALLAAGSDFDVIEAWLLRNGGAAEATPAPVVRSGGLYAERQASAASVGRPASRYVFPAGALS